MLYHLFAPMGKSHLFFNLFNYISFRAAGAVVTALLLAFFVGPAIIRRLQLAAASTSPCTRHSSARPDCGSNPHRLASR